MENLIHTFVVKRHHLSRLLCATTLLFCWTSLLSASSPEGPTGNEAASGPVKVFIDMGHGGKDHGAQGMLGLQESDLALRVGKLVRSELQATAKWRHIPLDVKVSRESDVFLALKERAEMANHWGADVFVSVHANSAERPLAHGFEVYFLSPEATDDEASTLATLENAKEEPLTSGVLSILSDVQTTYRIEESDKFAQKVFTSMAKGLKPNVRGVRQAPFTVLSGTVMPALLVEIGYLNHPEDARHLVRISYLKKLANAVSSGIIDFILESRKII